MDMVKVHPEDLDCVEINRLCRDQSHWLDTFSVSNVAAKIKTTDLLR